MLIGLISDVHANLPALTTVLDDAPELDYLLHAGDIVGYNPYPNGVIERFIEEEVISILGNHDRAVLSGGDNRLPPTVAAAIDWTRKRLTQSNTNYLEDLTQTRSLQFDGVSFKIVHGAPCNPERYVYPDSITRDLLVTEDVLIMGHTHYPVFASFEECVLVNPGSVGQPRDGDLRAAYSVYDTDTKSVAMRRCNYPVEDVIANIKESSLAESLTEPLS